MFQFNMREIIDAASSLAVFRAGFDLFKQNHVHRFNYNEELQQLFAKVDDGELYHVDIKFKNGIFQNSFCECREFYEKNGHCKHITSALIYAKLSDEALPKKVTLTDLLDYYLDEDFEEIVGKEIIPIKYILNHEDYRNYLNMKIGHHEYILKEPLSFFRHLKKHEAYEFGKKFTFDPYMHSFSAEDIKILSFLEEIMRARQFTSYLLDSPGQDHKDIYLSDDQLYKFLSMLESIEFVMDRDNKFYEIDHSELDLRVILREIEDGFHIDLNELLEYHVLDKDSRVLLKDKIYLTSDQQHKELYPFLNLSKNNNRYLKIERNQLDNFMTYLYPIINRTCKVRLNRELRERLIKEKCVPKLYLDYSDKITAELLYHYGDYVFDAFSTHHPTEQIVLRDLKKENKVMHLIETCAFKVSKRGYYMENPDHIFDFLDEGLERLKEDIEVYLSESFDILEVKDYQSVHVETGFDDDLSMFSIQFSVDGINPNEIDSLIKDMKANKKYYRLDNGSFLNLNDERFQTLSEVIEEEKTRVPSYMTLYMKDIASTWTKEDFYQKLIDDLSNPEDFQVQVPQLEVGHFRSYQETGFKWLKSLSKYSFGGVLADDMGLGKTMQTLSYIQSELTEHKQLTLIVAPTSLTYNWLNEVSKFFPKLSCVVVDGLKNKRIKLLDDIDTYDLIITSYALVRNDLDLYKALDIDICIIDEAQHIKNPYSKTAKALKALNCKQKFALTGTPIENGVMELWSIFDFIMPGYLGNMTQFKERYEKPIREGITEQSKKLRTIIDPFILRRLKKDVLKELPDKIENQIVVELHEDQKKVYLAFLNQVRDELMEAYRMEGYQKSQMKTLAALMRLRQICLDPSLFLKDYTGQSAKMNLLKELIEELMDGQHQILIFSQFTKMLDKIKDLLEDMGYGYFSLDGSTPSQERYKLVDRFNAGEKPIFLISLKAGGTGLNLTGADTVIHFDPWWNPAVEDQATDRAHRIGQEKTVHVIKMVSKGTIEEKIYALQMKKKALIDSLIKPGETMLHHLSEREIIDLFEEV